MNQITVANVTTDILSFDGVRVCTSKQLAAFYDCKVINLQQNFNDNKSRFEEGKHFIRIKGSQVSDFARYSKIPNTEIPEATTVLMLWTEKGAARHAKMLSTDKAWDVFEQLEDTYFQIKESAPPALTNMPRTFSEALYLAASLAQRNEALAVKADAFDTFANESGVFGIMESANQCNMMDDTLVDILTNSRGAHFWLCRNSLNGRLRCTKDGQRNGFVTTRRGYPRITAKGLHCLVEMFSVSNRQKSLSLVQVAA